MPARPWNQPSLAVYSLATRNFDTATTNMNICTYVTAVSMDPKLILVAVYNGTKTLKNLEHFPKGILQILSQDQLNLVKKFGKTSGNTTEKLAKLKDPLEMLNGINYLANCVSYMELDFTKAIEIKGDHILYLGKVVSSKTLNPKAEILTTGFLKEKKVIR